MEDEAFENKDAEVPAACYLPDADFLVRSTTRKNEIISSYEDFKKLRETFDGKQATNRFGVTWKEIKVDNVK